MRRSLFTLLALALLVGAVPAAAQADATITCTGSGHTTPIDVSSTTTVSLGPGYGTCSLSGVIPTGAVVNDLIVAINAQTGAGNAGTINLQSNQSNGGNESIVASGTFANSGTIDDTATAFLQELGGNILNTGTIEDTGGGTSELWFDGGPTTAVGTLENAGGGVLSISGGSFEVKPPMQMKLDAGSTTTIAAAAVGDVVATPLEIAGGTVNGTLAMPSGGTVTYDSGSSGSSGSLQVSSPVSLAGTIPSGWTVTVNTGTLSPQSGAANAGTLVLTGGAPTITAAGAFTNSGTISDTTSSRALVTASPLTNSGHLSLSSASILQLTGNLQLTSSSILTDSISGTSAGNTFGLLEVSGTASLGGALTAQFANYAPAVGDTQQLLTAGSVTGSFASTSLAGDSSSNVTKVQLGSTFAQLVTSSPSSQSPTPTSHPPIAPTISSMKVNRRERSVTFKFSSSGATGTSCALVPLSKQRGRLRKPHFSACASPRTYTHLRPGSYRFEVRATNTAGTSTTLTRRFSI